MSKFKTIFQQNYLFLLFELKGNVMNNHIIIVLKGHFITEFSKVVLRSFLVKSKKMNFISFEFFFWKGHIWSFWDQPRLSSFWYLSKSYITSYFPWSTSRAPRANHLKASAKPSSATQFPASTCFTSTETWHGN